METVVNKNDLVYFGSYGSGATCISGMLKVMPEFKEIVKKVHTVNNFIQNKERKSIKDYEYLRKKINALKVFYTYIEPHTSNENYFITINTCEKDCLVSKLEGLDFCPRDINNSYKKTFYVCSTKIHPLILY
ncbi:MAG: hypothetical protein ACFFAN_01775 [Promethearchaeota archaeon]